MALISLIMQPNLQNYMDDLATVFMNSESSDSLDDWRQLSFTHKIRYMLEKDALPSNSKWMRDALAQSKCMASKNDTMADKYRQEGNRMFQKKWYQKALEAYTECIRYSSTETVHLGYSNRSAALYHLELYPHALADIQLALDNHLVPKLRHKVLNRRALCYKHLGRPVEAMDNFQKALNSLADAEMDDVKLGKTKNEIEKEMGALKLDGPVKELEEAYPAPRVPEVVGGRSDHMTQASQYVEMTYSPERGRYLVAAHDLSAGDAIIRERPYAAVLLPDFYNTHCHHCFTRTTAPIPCSTCPVALYCTPRCREDSWNTYHRIECSYLPLLHVVGIAHLSLRVVVVSGLQFLKSFRVHEHSEYDLSMMYEFGYESVYHLVHHTDDMPTGDLIQYAMSALVLLKCLQTSTFFTDGNDVTSSDDVTYIGGLLLRHVQQLVCNAHAVSDWSVSGGDPRNQMVCDVMDARIATAIYPTASLMNHSCDPNIISNFYTDTLVIRCTKSIKRGEEIYNCYGPHYNRMELPDRQRALQMQYFFSCDCTACSNPNANNERHKAFKCPACEGPIPRPKPGEFLDMKCSHCAKIYYKKDFESMIQTMYHAQTKMSEGIQLADNGDIQGAKDSLRQCLRQQKRVLYKEHEDMAATCDQLARIYTLEENYKKAEHYVDFSVKVVGRIHGYGSVEYGTELKKLAQIQFSGMMVAKCRQNLDRALSILRANLGEEADQVKELVTMDRCLQAV